MVNRVQEGNTHCGRAGTEVSAGRKQAGRAQERLFCGSVTGALSFVFLLNMVVSKLSLKALEGLQKRNCLSLLLHLYSKLQLQIIVSTEYGLKRNGKREYVPSPPAEHVRFSQDSVSPPPAGEEKTSTASPAVRFLTLALSPEFKEL